MATCYILRCADGSYYVGSTRDLGVRMEQHAAGLVSSYTSKRLPFELVWSAEFERIDDAYVLEKRIQGWSRRKREALIRGEFEALPDLSRKRQPRGTLSL